MFQNMRLALKIHRKSNFGALKLFSIKMHAWHNFTTKFFSCHSFMNQAYKNDRKY